MMKRILTFPVLVGSLVISLGAGASLKAEPCAYDVSSLPFVTGVVSRIMSGGVLLQDGTVIVLPESLLPYARLDQTLSLYGLKARHEQKVWALALAGQGKGEMPICPSLQEVKKGAYPGSPAYDVILTGKKSSDDVEYR